MGSVNDRDMQKGSTRYRVRDVTQSKAPGTKWVIIKGPLNIDIPNSLCLGLVVGYKCKGNSTPEKYRRTAASLRADAICGAW